VTTTQLGAAGGKSRLRQSILLSAPPELAPGSGCIASRLLCNHPQADPPDLIRALDLAGQGVIPVTMFVLHHTVTVGVGGI